ncbi:MAG: LON peptidase substrate-binding domain-containing protein, partial [bacterium]
MEAQEYSSRSGLPVVVTRNFVLYPDRTVPLVINRAQSVAAIEESLSKYSGRVLIVAQRKETGDGSRVFIDDPFAVGVVATVDRKIGDSKRGFQLIVTGLDRVRIKEIKSDQAFLFAQYSDDPVEQDCDEATAKALLMNARILGKEILALLPGDTSQLEVMLDAVDDLNAFLPIVAENLDVTVGKKQEILEVSSLKAKTLMILELMADQKKTLEIQVDVRNKLTEKMGKHQREAILREQIRTIRDELGETKSVTDEDYVRRINEANLPEAVRVVALDEARRLEAVGSSSPETHIIRNYLDLILAIPWTAKTEDLLDLKHAKAVLDADHFGLEKIKKRIIQHLAVMKLKKDKRGSILLFVGPPGVGKTSLGESIARALGRKFTRVALGGVRDDAEIRGHRKTYIGAMPGRIIQSIKRVGVSNPVFLLDEVDKLGRGYTGDPAAALLEVLDPEQNKEFTDHFLDVPYDLSQVFFIATANSLDTIPGPLLDRM